MISEIRMTSGTVPQLIEGSGVLAKHLPGIKSAKDPANLDFGDLFRDTVGEVGNLEQQARVAIQGLMSGTGVDVHQALIASEKATAGFELALALRNKAIQSYQTVMSMQF